MRWHRVKAIARKEVIQIRRDLRSLLLILAMPLLLMLAFGYGVSFDIKHIPVFVYDREGSQQSQDLLKHFQASEYFSVVQSVASYAELVQALDAGWCRVAIVVPSDFSEKLKTGGPVGIQALLDATDNNTANVSIGYSETVIQTYNRKVQLEWLQRHGQMTLQPAVSVDARTWFNEDLESTANIVPGVIAIVMAVIGSFLTSLTIAREWERGTMEQLMSTPVTPLEVMVGKLMPYFVIGLFDTALCAGIGVWWFHVPFRGQWSVFLFSSMLFLTVVLSLGYCHLCGGQIPARSQPDCPDRHIFAGLSALRIYLSHRPNALSHPTDYSSRPGAVFYDDQPRCVSQGDVDRVIPR